MTGNRQLESVSAPDERPLTPVFEGPAGQQPVRGELADHYPGTEYFDLAVSLFASARREVMLVNGQMNGFEREAIEHFRGRITALRERSLAVSLICHPDELDGHGRREFLHRITREHGAQARVSTARLQGTFIIDRRWALMWNPQQDRHCVLVHSPIVVEPLLRLADAAWEAACDLETFVQCHHSRLHEKTSQILQLLSSGHKDEAAARELGVSLRTYRRHVANLMDKLDAESRFEAGVKATALGLVRARTRERSAAPLLISRLSGMPSAI